ncbi:hypothetical protein SLA2020_321500 [Shorea laevis]
MVAMMSNQLSLGEQCNIRLKNVKIGFLELSFPFANANISNGLKVLQISINFLGMVNKQIIRPENKAPSR